MSYSSDAERWAPCDACGWEDGHARGCPRDGWEMAQMEEYYEHCRLTELYLGAAAADEAEMTTQPETTEGWA